MSRSSQTNVGYLDSQQLHNLPSSAKVNMVVSIVKIITWLGAASAALAVPIEPRAVINHDAVVGFPETVPSGLTGQLYLKYKPWLKVFTGCVPFPAVNAAGDTG